MSGQLLSPSEFALSAPGDATSGLCVAIWLDMLDAGHKLVIAGLTRDVGPNGDVGSAYREWYSQQMAGHDQVVSRMLWRMQQSRRSDAL